MASFTASLIPPPEDAVLRSCADALTRVAAYSLPQALDQRLLWLSENKERLDQAQHEELEALVELADHRSLDKVQAAAVLKQLANLHPELVSDRA